MTKPRGFHILHDACHSAVICNIRGCLVTFGSFNGVGPNDHTIAQIKDAVRDGLRAVKNTIEDESIVLVSSFWLETFMFMYSFSALSYNLSCHNYLIRIFSFSFFFPLLLIHFCTKILLCLLQAGIRNGLVILL